MRDVREGRTLNRRSAPNDSSGGGLDYDQMIPLDAEAPAEGGIGEAYRTNVLPRRRRFLDGQRPIADVIVLFTIVNDQLPWPHTPVLRDQRRQRPRRSVSHA